MSIEKYKSGDPIALLGMSGVGKTRISNLLRAEAGWFHYSVDYRIGTRYLDEAIEDLFKREAMKNPLLRELLLSDSIYISSNITFDNLDPLSAFLGKPGDPAKGGIAFAEYTNRQRLHREAEISALLDTPLFVEKAKQIYGYDQFVCDTGGSICEVVDPHNKDDRVLNVLSSACLLIYIAGDEAHSQALIERFSKSPKPMYYNEIFLQGVWREYLSEKDVAEDSVDPDDFIRWGFAKMIDWRRPRYEAIAKNWGVTLNAKDVEQTQTPEAFLALVDEAVSKRR